MRAYSKRSTSLKRNIRKKFNLSKRKSLKKSLRKKQIRKRKSIKRGGSRKLKSKRSKQLGGYQTAQVACSNSNSTVDGNKNLFESSFSIESNTNNNNTAPPTCSFVGVNSSGTTAYSCL